MFAVMTACYLPLYRTARALQGHLSRAAEPRARILSGTQAERLSIARAAPRAIVKRDVIIVLG